MKGGSTHTLVRNAGLGFTAVSGFMAILYTAQANADGDSHFYDLRTERIIISLLAITILYLTIEFYGSHSRNVMIFKLLVLGTLLGLSGYLVSHILVNHQGSKENKNLHVMASFVGGFGLTGALITSVYIIVGLLDSRLPIKI